jgi:hypothetical protein
MIEDVFLPALDSSGDDVADQPAPSDLIDRNLSNFIPLLNLQQNGQSVPGGQQ